VTQEENADAVIEPGKGRLSGGGLKDGGNGSTQKLCMIGMIGGEEGWKSTHTHEK